MLSHSFFQEELLLPDQPDSSSSEEETNDAPDPADKECPVEEPDEQGGCPVWQITGPHLQVFITDSAAVRVWEIGDGKSLIWIDSYSLSTRIGCKLCRQAKNMLFYTITLVLSRISTEITVDKGEEHSWKHFLNLVFSFFQLS